MSDSTWRGVSKPWRMGRCSACLWSWTIRSGTRWRRRWAARWTRWWRNYWTLTGRLRCFNQRRYLSSHFFSVEFLWSFVLHSFFLGSKQRHLPPNIPQFRNHSSSGHRLNHRFIDCLFEWSDHRLIDWLIDWPIIDRSIDGWIDWLIDGLIDWLTDRSIHRLIDWLIDWLMDESIDWLIDWDLPYVYCPE